MSAENPKFWGFDGDEVLTHDNIEELIDDWIGSLDSDAPETIEVLGYDQMEVDQKRYANWTLENLLESLDDEYAGEDPVKPTEIMKQASAEFIAKVAAEYHVWNCEIVCRKTVKVADYIKQEESK